MPIRSPLKLAALAKLRQQKDEQRCQMEAEANRLEEERLEQELERMWLVEEERKKWEAAAAAET